MTRIFISYSSHNEDFVRSFAKQLHENNVDTWIDWKDIPPGVPWRQAIYDGILGCEFFMPVLSPDYLESEMCRMESYLARAHFKKLLPIMYQDCYRDASNYVETKHLPDLYYLSYYEGANYSFGLSDEDKLSNILTVVNGKIPERKQWHAYIAYPLSELRFGERIWYDLQNDGIPTWMASKCLYIGDDWNTLYWNALRTANVFLPILTIDAARSFYMKKEVLLARTLNLPMLPIIAPTAIEKDQSNAMREALDESYEMRLLSELQWIQPDPSYETMLTTLKKMVNQILEKDNKKNM